MSALEPIEVCADRLAWFGFTVDPFADESDEGCRFHAANIAPYDRALAADEEAFGLSFDATKTRRAASVAMERNLARGSVVVGMLGARRIA